MQKEYEYQAVCVYVDSYWTSAQLANLDLVCMCVCTATRVGLLSRVCNERAVGVTEGKTGNEQTYLNQC